MSKEGYRDPTADIAIANVMNEYRRKKQAGGNIGKEPERKGGKSQRTVQERN